MPMIVRRKPSPSFKPPSKPIRSTHKPTSAWVSVLERETVLRCRSAVSRELRLMPDDPKALAFVADILLKNGNTQEAEADLKQAIQRDDKLAMAHVDLGTIYYERKKTNGGNRAVSGGHQERSEALRRSLQAGATIPRSRTHRPMPNAEFAIVANCTRAKSRAADEDQRPAIEHDRTFCAWLELEVQLQGELQHARIPHAGNVAEVAVGASRIHVVELRVIEGIE